MIRPSGRIPRILERLSDRPDLGRTEAIRQFWSHYPPGPLNELFDLIETELGFSIGLLRPEDSLDQILAPFSVRNPLTWIFEEAALEDGTSEINYQLKRREQGSPQPNRIRTVEQLVSRWCHAG